MLVKICEHQSNEKFKDDETRGLVCKLPISNLNEKKVFQEVI